MKFKFVNPTQSIELMTLRFPLLRKMIFFYYKPIVSREISLGKIQKEDHVLCIGGGPFPCTALLIHHFTGATVTVIDNNNSCCNASKGLLKVLKLDHKVKVKCMEGMDVSAEAFDVIHLASQIMPKEKIFNKLRESSRKGGKILVRIPKKSLSNGYDNFTYSEENLSHFESQPFYSNIKKTLLYNI